MSDPWSKDSPTSVKQFPLFFLSGFIVSVLSGKFVCHATRSAGSPLHTGGVVGETTTTCSTESVSLVFLFRQGHC